ncbi:hypothetical protein VKT23_015874 [Stygiomarasmius scandens]|uniref:Uncharacterized protein n=1 Tax=Marasmiellus scandens TaxID=2682957 RepID=A0ABR1IZM4_9AGAR
MYGDNSEGSADSSAGNHFFHRASHNRFDHMMLNSVGKNQYNNTINNNSPYIGNINDNRGTSRHIQNSGVYNENNGVLPRNQSSQSIWSRPSTPTTLPASNVQGNAGSTSYIEENKLNPSESLPENILSDFLQSFKPAVIELTGCLRAWANPSLDQLHEIWMKVMPNHMQDFFINTETKPVVEGCVCQILDEWRDSIGNAAIEALEHIFQDPDLQTASQRKIYVSQQISGDYWLRPYYFSSINNQSNGQTKHEGAFQSYIISKTLSAHFKAIQPISADQRLSDRPTGALVLTILAIERAFQFYSSGEKIIPPDSSREFSRVNWDDRTVTRDGRPYQVKTTSRIQALFGKNVHGVERVGSDLWDKIIAAALNQLESENSSEYVDKEDEGSGDESDDDVFYSGDEWL